MIADHIRRHPCLLELRRGIEAEISATGMWRSAAQRLIDLLTIATATWYGRACRSDDQSERMGAVVDHLWAAAEILAGNHPPRTAAEAILNRDRARCAEASLWALIGCDPLFQNAARAYFRLPKSRHQALAIALLMPSPLGAKWETATSPICKVIDEVERNHDQDENRGGRIERTDAMYCGVDRGTVPLEEVADITADAVLVRRYTECSLLDLQQAVAAADDELRAYLQARISTGGTLEAICRHLGWTDARGRRVDRRFRRLRSDLVEKRDLRKDLIETDRPSLAASLVTFYVEHVRSGLDLYQHVPPGPPEFYGRRPVSD